MSNYDENRRRLNWKIGVAAIVISLLIHETVFFSLGLLGVFDRVEEEKKMQVSLVHEPAEPEKPEKKEEKKKEKLTPLPPQAPPPVPPPIKPKMKPIPKTPMKTPVTEPDPAPAEEHLGNPDAPTIATSPDPKTATPARLQTQLNWQAFDRTLGENAVQERIAYKDKLDEKRGGGFKFGKMSAKVQRSINDHRSWISGAPKEPPGTKSLTFKQYLEATHDEIHHLFADSFLTSLISLGADDPLNDFTLMTLVEFQILENGVINDVHVIKTSGLAMFDAGAVDSLYRSSPFLPPPKSILSYDNRVYFRWGFYRNQRKCGTFNATGYILKGPAGAPVPIPDEKRLIIDG